MPLPFDPSKLNPQLVPVAVPRQPTDAEKAETEHVRCMQARRDAIGLALSFYTGGERDRVELLSLADEIARFIISGR